MAYNIIKGKVEFSNSTTGSIESLVDNWRNQSVGGVKTFTNTVSASAFWDTDAGGEVRALKSLIGSDGANRVLTSDGDGTLTAESNLTIDAIGNTGQISLSAAGQGCHITGSTFSGSAHGITGILLNPDHLASENYDGLANRLSASNLVLGIGLSSSVHVAPASSGHGPELQVTGGQGIVVDTEGVRVLTASNGGLAFTGLTLQVDASKTTNKGGGPSNNDEFIIADSSDSDSIKNLTYSQIKTAIADSISVPITSYTNNGDNRIITSVNSTTVNAEANLSFDGSGLQVSGNISVSGSEHMPGFFIDNSQIASHSNTNIGINTDKPDGTLTVTRLAAQSITYLQRSGSAFASDGLDIAEIRFQHKTPGLGGNASRYSARILAEADGSEHNAESQPGRLSFWTCPTGTVDPVQRMMINNSGNIGIGTSTIPHTLTVAGTVSASLGVSALSFTGDGSGLTGVTGEWDGSHTGNATIDGTLSASNGLRSLDLLLDAGGTGRVGVTGDPNLMTLTADTVTVEGAVNATTLSASLGITGSSFELYAEGGGTSPFFKAQNGILSASGVSTLDQVNLDRLQVGSVIGDVSASLGLAGLGIVLDATSTIGTSNDTDLMTLSTDKVTVAGQTKIDRDYSDTDHAMIDALHIDFDKTGNTTSNNTMYGIFLDMDNTTATNGNNTMYGLHVTPTLTHAADAGTPVVYGALINAQGGTNGGSLVQAARFEAGGGDINYGIQLDVEDGGVDLRIESSADSGDYFQIQTTTHGATTITTVDDDATAADLTFTIDGDINLNPAGGDVNIVGALSASGQVNLPGAVQFGTENQTTVSSVGILSSSATATFANVTLDRATLQEINTIPAGNGTVELIGGINTTGHISSSLGVHVTGSEASVAIGDHKGTGMVGMLAIRPSGDLEEAENNKIHILCQRSEASDLRTIFAVSGSGKVAVGGGHLDGVLNVSGSGVEKLISAKSDLHNPAFYVSGSGDTFIKGATINSGSFTSSGSVRAPLLRETIHTYAPGDTDASYVRFYEPGRNTSFDKKVIMVKPYLGNLDKIIARGTSAAGSTAISFHKAGDGSATPNGTAIETVTVDMSSANTSYTFMFDPGTSKFAAGDVVSVKVNPSTDPGDIVLTCVWEYDTRTT